MGKKCFPRLALILRNGHGITNNCTILASHAVVQNTATPVHIPPNQAATSQTDMFSRTKHNSRTVQKCKLETIRLESQWSNTLLEKHWSEKCGSVFSNFIAKSTFSQYNNYIALFQKFCITNVFFNAEIVSNTLR